MSPDTAALYTKYYAGHGVGGADRLKGLAFVRNLVASEFSAYQEVLAVHAGGLARSREADGAPQLRLDRGRRLCQAVRRLCQAHPVKSSLCAPHEPGHAVGAAMRAAASRLLQLP